MLTDEVSLESYCHWRVTCYWSTKKPPDYGFWINIFFIVSDFEFGKLFLALAVTIYLFLAKVEFRGLDPEEDQDDRRPLVIGKESKGNLCRVFVDMFTRLKKIDQGHFWSIFTVRYFSLNWISFNPCKEKGNTQIKN